MTIGPMMIKERVLAKKNRKKNRNKRTRRRI